MLEVKNLVTEINQKLTSRHIIFNLQKSKDKEKNLERSQRREGKPFYLQRNKDKNNSGLLFKNYASKKKY